MRTIFLNEYLESGGEKLPSDIDDFIYEHKNGNLCLWCEEFHSFIPVYKITNTPYKYSDISAVKTGAHACLSCAELTKTIEDKINYSSIELNDIEEYSEFNKTRHTESSTFLRMQKFKLSRTLEYDVNRFYAHLKVDTDPYSRTTINCCYFCRKKIGSIEAPKSVFLAPVESNVQLTGGEVNFCLDHIDYGEIEDHQDESMLAAQYCVNPECKKRYLVAIEEYNARLLTNSLGKHYCPACAHSYVNSLTDPTHPFFYAPNQIPRRTRPAERIILKECCNPTCNNNALVDLSIEESINLRLHTRNGSLYCKDCIITNSWKSNKNKISIRLNPSTLVAIFKLGKFWRYKIYRILQGKDPKVEYASDDVCEDVYAATFIALEEAQKLSDNDQLKIWENQ